MIFFLKSHDVECTVQALNQAFLRRCGYEVFEIEWFKISQVFKLIF